MGDKTAIEWSESTWNPLAGCSRVSEGCRNCYAERTAYRLAAMGNKTYDGLTKKVGSEIRWTGEVRLVESTLELPLRWKKPRRVFVNSMSDLFHERVSDAWIVAIYDVMLRAPQHTFQILTKRPERMRDWVTRVKSITSGIVPPPHIWLGVSVEDQATADERIPLLLQTPAAVRWVSYEPAIGPVDFERIRMPHGVVEIHSGQLPGIDWTVVGGESGPGARPFDLAWARKTIDQCYAAGVPVFVKQIGARPWWDGLGPPPPEHIYLSPGAELNGKVGWALDCLRDRKGGDVSEWPSDLRIREYPRP